MVRWSFHSSTETNISCSPCVLVLSFWAESEGTQLNQLSDKLSASLPMWGALTSSGQWRSRNRAPLQPLSYIHCQLPTAIHQPFHILLNYNYKSKCILLRFLFDKSTQNSSYSGVKHNWQPLTVRVVPHRKRKAVYDFHRRQTSTVRQNCKKKKIPGNQVLLFLNNLFV